MYAPVRMHLNAHPMQAHKRGLDSASKPSCKAVAVEPHRHIWRRRAWADPWIVTIIFVKSV